MPLLKRLTANLALILGGVLAAMLIAEAILRVTPLGKTSFYTYDPELGWTLVPGAHGWLRDEGVAYLSVNRWGYRGPDWQLAKPPGTFRVAVLGDSMTEAQQVAEQDTFCAVIQRSLTDSAALKSAGFKRAEVMNFGCDGYGTAQELIVLKRRVWKFSPDVIVLAVFLGNDVRNNSVTLEGDKCRPFYVYRGDGLVLGGPFEDSWSFRMGCMMRFESRHSQVLNLLGEARSTVRAWWRRRRARRNGQSGNGALAARGQGSLDARFMPSADSSWIDAWRVTEGEITMVQQDVVYHGARLLVATLTTGDQVNPNAAERDGYAKRLGVSNLFYSDYRVKQLGERNGFAVLNLAPAMQQYATAEHAYLHGFSNSAPGVGHWNAHGHLIAGQLIAARLSAMIGPGSVPTPSSGHASASGSAASRAGAELPRFSPRPASTPEPSM